MNIPGGTRKHLLLIVPGILWTVFWQTRLLRIMLSQFQAGIVHDNHGFLPPNEPNNFFYLPRFDQNNSSKLREGPLEQNEMLDVSTNVKGKGSSSSMSPTILPVVNSESLQGHPTRKWAYAFLVGGCSSKNLEYRGFLYNAVAAAQRLKMMGSKADVVVLLQMSVKSKETRLPEDEERLLTAMGIKFQYLPKFNHEVHEVFYALVKEKFRILDLTDYSRVLFIDADIMPLCSLDYLFELSEPEDGPGILKENVVIGWRREAANAGFFMLKPNREDYLDLQEVILRKEQKALDLPWPHWDEVEGWGHRIVAPDFWRGPDRASGTNWTWHAVFADQGLLYHWTKYVKQSVSLIIGNQIENWGSRNGTVVLEGTMKGLLNNSTCDPMHERGNYLKHISPYRDFRHFTGRSKPWQQNRSSLFDTVELSSNNQNSHTEQWYRALKIAQLQTGIVLNFDFAKGEIDKAPPVGRFSDYGQMIKHIRVRASQNWTAYERGESAQTFSPPKPRKALRLSRSTPRKSSNLREGPLEQNEMLDVSTNVKGKGSSSSMSPTILPVVNSESLQGHPTRKWAYAFLVGGCSSKNLEYRGFLYNAVAAAQRLKMMGSKADVVVLLQMSVKSKETRLPEDEERLLTAMGIKFQYLPKFNHEVHEVFYALVKEKFRILDLTDYSRVLFIDADIMPLCSLDYLFELSEPEDGPGILKENVVIGWRREAANAGFFMLKPNREDYLDLQEVILRKEQKALDLSWPHWDEVEGWGHRIVAPDFWRAPDGGTGTNWTWHAVFADQGLLYHWTKYVKQSVSLIIGKQVENWGSRNGTAYLEGTQKEVLSKFTCIPPLRGGRYMAPSPYQDFRHFTGKSKPWQQNRSSIFENISLSGNDDPKDHTKQWYRALKLAESQTGVELNFDFAKGEIDKVPPVGRFSDYGQMIKHIRSRAKHNWTAAYE